MVKILIVEDNEELLDLVAGYFKSKGSFDVFTAADGNAALRLVDEKDFDIAILDIMLPGPDGFEICKALRGKSRCPIVFLTALGNEDNILKGYEIGADEYMVKPFSPKVLYAKCLALLSRTEAELTKEVVIECGDIRLYPLRMDVEAGGHKIKLAPKEYFLHQRNTFSLRFSWRTKASFLTETDSWTLCGVSVLTAPTEQSTATSRSLEKVWAAMDAPSRL